ncbi:MAG: ectoine synthase [Pseudomonadota bacterium]
MIVRTIEDLEKLGRIKFPADASFRSARFFTANDGLGFSYNENRVKKGTDLTVWLKHHWEANYIVSGRGEVTDLTSGESWPLAAGVLYVVGPNDRHRLCFSEDECHISIFHPPLTGNERFDSDGAYEPSGPIPVTDRRIFHKTIEGLRKAGQEEVSNEAYLRKIALLTQNDDIGFGLSHQHIKANAQITLDKETCWRAFHILAGTGHVSDLTSGKTASIAPSTAFTMGPDDQHRLSAASDLHLLCVTSFVPDSGL